MSARRIATATTVAALLVFAALGVTGCWGKKSTQSATTPQVTPPPAVATATPEPTATTVPTTTPTPAIATPALGTAERTALLDAARKKFGTSSSFYVYQLFTEGGNAIGDIEPVNGSSKRAFVAWSNGPKKWAVVWTTPYGSSAASKAGADSALPAFSEALLGKMAWALSRPPVTSEKSMRASLTVAAKKAGEKTMEGVGAPYQTEGLKVAQDSKGTWWGVVTVQPSTDSAGQTFEPLNMWAKFTDGAWKIDVLDPEPPAPSSFFPKAIIAKLGL
jgi:hypothetical protein